jgi:hypothetical protein
MESQARQDYYDQLIGMGYTPDEAWAEISTYEFAEDYE